MSTAHPYIPNLDTDVRAAMLKFIGAASIEEFYSDIPTELRVSGLLDLPEPFLAEQDLVKHVTSLLGKNIPTTKTMSFLGAGTYNHYVPAVVDEVINRAEFLTAYTGRSYEDHGRYQALFEYESLMAELLNMDVVNVPTYDGLAATSTAIAMSERITGRRKVIVASDVNPDKFSKVKNFNLRTIDFILVPTVDGVADVAAISKLMDSQTAAIWIESPSYLGALEIAIEKLSQLAHEVGAILIVGTDPIALGVIQSPADQGADIVCGDIQSLGLHQWFGGAHGGFIAVHDDTRFIMEMPSRLYGLETTSVAGEYGFGEVAYGRTSLAKREAGKEWVGTAAALWGIAAAVYLSLMGPAGMREVGETILARTQYAASLLSKVPGLSIKPSAANFREFVLEIKSISASDVVAKARKEGIEPGVVLNNHQILVCVTEMNSQVEIDHLVACLAKIMGGRS